MGVYEPLWPQLADGKLRSSSYLNLDRHEASVEALLRHHVCLAPDVVSPGPET
jgi:hypothetical protein